MACCPPAPSVSTTAAVATEANGPESDIRPTENVDCYMSRGGNTTGQHDDATDNVLDKIENTAIPISQPPRFDNIQFRLTDGSTAGPVTWSWTNNGGASLALLGVSLTSSGVLNGDIDEAAWNLTFKVTVTATGGSGVIDSRTYVFSPESAGAGEDIKFVSPLPGAIVNSKFGPRLHPIQQVMKPHTGIDMKYADRSVKDVVAAADGEVVLAGGDRTRGYGLRVWIRHRSRTGQHLCDTTYNHLERIYVQVGQKVMAGQAIGREGSTGASTGPHLHFECKLPNGTFIDPEPLIRGQVLVARSTQRNGNPVPSSIETRTGTASLTSREVAARANGCEAFGPGYPVDPTEPTGPVTPESPPGVFTPAEDAFEIAWFYTMTEEVGPFWDTSYPLDAEVIAGLIGTAAQRRKVGYVNTANFPGGETKFGVAQKPNPSILVRDIGYAAAKELGFNAYWRTPTNPCTGRPALLAIMNFDINYLHGQGNGRRIWNDAVAAGMNVAASTFAEQVQACRILSAARESFIRSIPRPEYTASWLSRAARTRQLVESLGP